MRSTFVHNVVATYDEYVAQRDIDHAGRDQHLRSAVSSALALYHFREHIPGTLRPAYKIIVQKCPEYLLLRGVTNAGKHKIPRQEPVLVSDAKDILERLVLVQYDDENGDYFHAQTVINVRCTDNTLRNLDAALTRTLNYWGKFLYSAGILKYTDRPELPAPGSFYIPRANASRRLNLEAARGLNFKQHIQFLKFDNSLGRAVPIDIEGMQSEGHVYKAQEHFFDVKMTHPQIGEVIVSLPLTGPENLEYHLLHPDERGAFVEKLAKDHHDEIVKMIERELKRRDENNEDTASQR